SVVEPELKKCMDVFEMVVVDDVFPRVDKSVVETEFEAFVNETASVLHQQPEVTENKVALQRISNDIQMQKLKLQNSIQILDFLKQQEDVMHKYEEQVKKINSDL